jgi:hypothetical protein
VLWLVTLLASFDPMEWLTIGLVIFAGAQIFVQVRTEQGRLRERQEDEERAEDLAFQLAWAEHFRIDGLADEWERADLVQLSCLGILNPADVLPRDWTTVMSALAHLSVESGYLGGVALTLAHDTARKIGALNSVVRDVIKKYPADSSTVTMAETVHAHHPEMLADLQKQIRATSRDLSRLMFDAVAQSRRAKIHRVMDFSDDMRSSFGKRAVQAIKEREQESLKRRAKQIEGQRPELDTTAK